MPSICKLDSRLMEGLKWTLSCSNKKQLTTDLTWLVKTLSLLQRLAPALHLIGCSVCFACTKNNTYNSIHDMPFPIEHVGTKRIPHRNSKTSKRSGGKLPRSCSFNIPLTWKSKNLEFVSAVSVYGKEMGHHLISAFWSNGARRSNSRRVA